MATLDPAAIARLVSQVEHWHHTIHFPGGISSPGAYDPGDLLQRLGLPDLSGKRVLDVGTRDGYFAFACERLGAEVVAIDHVDPAETGFEIARSILGSQVTYTVANVYDLQASQLGQFDVVLFLGVLYHLRHPLLALDRLRGLCRGTLFVESLTCDAGVFTALDRHVPLAELAPGMRDLPFAQFLPRDRFHRDWTNKWSPNLACLVALVEDAEFTVTQTQTWGDRALVRAVAREDRMAQQRARHDAGVAVTRR
jgi:tRNA (mo5U34)-methyltransferase